MQQRLIEVVEDETTVHPGLVALLKVGGANVLSFDRVESVEAGLAAPIDEAPRLLLVDDGLPQGPTGIDALGPIRAL